MVTHRVPRGAPSAPKSDCPGCRYTTCASNAVSVHFF
jgi:hypothetical protein